MARKVIGAAILFVLMAVQVVIFIPPLWTIPVAVGLGILYYILRVTVSLRQVEDAVEFGFEAIMATVVVYAFLIVLLEISQ